MSVLYLVFRTLMRKQTFFQLNRVILLSIVGFSTIIPLVHLPQTIQPAISFQLAPVADKIAVYDLNLPAETAQTGTEVAGQTVETTSRQFTISWQKLLQIIYFSGLLVALLVSLTGFLNILVLFRKVMVISKDGFQLLITNDDIPAFSLGRYLFISKSDFETNGDTIITHEQAHIRFGHFYDLLILEAVKIIYWFNPVIYWLIRDLKEVHEFQADDSTLNYGIDVTQYQLLIIQKCVGHQKFALANSFNHCQIKNRIVMMNKEKSNNAWRWKVATFLPILALLLMAFGRTGQNSPPESMGSPTLVPGLHQDSLKQWSEADFGTNDQITKWVDSGKLPILIWYTCIIEIDSISKLHVNPLYEPMQLNRIPDHVRKYLDYSFADENTKPHFQKITINGQEKMMPKCTFIVKSDQSTPLKDYQKLLHTIGSTILEIRDKYANEIFKSSYAKLAINQRDEIDMLVPAIKKFLQSPSMAFEMKQPHPTLSVEIRKDGIFVDDKLCLSLEELRKKVESWKKENPKGGVRLSMKKEKGFSIPEDRLNEIRDALGKPRLPDEVDQKAEFPGGSMEMRKWIAHNLRYSVEAQEKRIQGTVFVNYVVNSEGKVVDAIIVRSVDPTLDAEALRVVSQMPVWKPAQWKGVPVNVDYTVPITFSLQ